MRKLQLSQNYTSIYCISIVYQSLLLDASQLLIRRYKGQFFIDWSKLYKFYFPCGVDNDEHINDDELALNYNAIEYMNDNVTHDDVLDTWLNILDINDLGESFEMF